MILDEVFKLCDRFNGVKEIGVNQDFSDQEFKALLIDAGWYTGAPYCSFSVRAIFKAAGAEYKYISGSAWRTALNGSLRGYEWTTKPKPGALMIWRNFKHNKPLSSGHIGIVHTFDSSICVTFEGNADTNDADTIQEFGRHARRYTGSVWRTANGLRLMGFLYPPHI